VDDRDPEARASALRPWRRRPRGRPARREPVAPGEESVWDYPRPPRLERATRPVRVALDGVLVARSARAWRVCETAGPPVYYVPLGDVEEGVLVPSRSRSLCEWKGQARYYDVRAGGRSAPDAAFHYADPEPGFEPLRDAVGFYPGRVACWLGEERVRPQPGDFYAGWITREIKGPFKGDPGTGGW
jgi:uncharacterized protein (DUF427 family)